MAERSSKKSRDTKSKSDSKSIDRKINREASSLDRRIATARINRVVPPKP